MILVTGATGQYGSKAIDYLLNKGIRTSDISALIRDTAKGQKLTEKGVELRVGDYTDFESLVNAFQNVDKLLMVSSNDKEIKNRTAQHENVIKAAKAAQVKHIAYTSFIRKLEVKESANAAFQDSHIKTEQLIKDSGIAYTILQNGIYLEMIPIFAGKVADTGVIMLPAQEGKASWVLREELAEAAAYVLTTNGHENKTYILTNTESVSFNEIATELSGKLGEEVQYQSPSVDIFQSILTQAGVPEIYIGLFTTWALVQANGELDIKDTTLQSFLERKPTTVKQFINQVYNQKETRSVL